MWAVVVGHCFRLGRKMETLGIDGELDIDMPTAIIDSERSSLNKNVCPYHGPLLVTDYVRIFVKKSYTNQYTRFLSNIIVQQHLSNYYNIVGAAVMQ